MFASGKSASVSAVANYIEDVFSTYLYTGNGSSQTITNGIDLAGKGGLTWIKDRSGANSHVLVDTVRGATNFLRSNSTNAQVTDAARVSAFTSSGFSVGNDTETNGSAVTYASWTFREQPKFFDIVTYTGDGINRTIAHNLGSVPGCIIVKKTSGADNWFVQHRSLGATKYIALNDADIAYTNSQLWNNTEPTSTVFTLGTNSGVNQSGGAYVAYLFAHDAGGFGLTGNDNVISCGSTGGGTSEITLGWEPQWLLWRSSNFTDNWQIIDNMRGASVGSPTYNTWSNLNANTSAAETSVTGSGANPNIKFTATGFVLGAIAGTAIYIAIRRGPMKVPTDGTKVFNPQTWTGSTGQLNVTTNFPVDLGISGRAVPGTGHYSYAQSRLTGVGASLRTNTTDAEVGPGIFYGFYMDSNTLAYMPGGNSNQWNATDGGGVGYAQSSWFFRRAPGFFDVVCYTGTGSATTFSHNLGVAPEMMIVKKRSAAGTDWNVYHSALGNTQVVFLDLTNATTTATRWNDTTPTASVFSIGSHTQVNESAATFVWYGFATCAGVSKVGSYTGTATTKQIDCGFTAGARFVLIKRTDSTGDWYVWDTARGIVSGNDPYLLLNSTAAEVTSTDYIDAYSAGFEISSTAPSAINASGGTFIFLAIA